MKDNELSILAQKISDGRATDEEIARYNHIINTLNHKKPDWNEEEMGDKMTIKEELLSRIQNQMHPPIQSTKSYRKTYWVASAAAVVLMVMSAVWYFYRTPSLDSRTPTVANATVIEPGGNKAILTLSDGSRIVLDSLNTGQILTYQGVKFTKTADGQLICEHLNGDIPTENL